MEKFIVYAYTNDGKDEVEVTGRAQIDSDGYLRFGGNDFVFARGSWSYYKRVKEDE